MTRRELERKLHDTSVSDTEFFKIVMRYFNELEAQDKKFKKGIYSPINSSEFEKRKEELMRLGELLRTLRPAVHEMMHQHTFGHHKYCCKPEKKKE